MQAGDTNVEDFCFLGDFELLSEDLSDAGAEVEVVFRVLAERHVHDHEQEQAKHRINYHLLESQ